MAIATLDTKDIQITAVQFSKNSPQLRFVSYPKKIVYGGREYVLATN